MPDVTLTPVAGDPWNGGAQDLHPSVAPPLTVSLPPSQLEQNATMGDPTAYDTSLQPEPSMTNLAALGQVALGAVQGIADAVTLPRDVMQGRVDPMSDQGIGRTLGMAGMMTGGLGEAALPEAEMLASRNARLYNPKPVEPRPLVADYPAGAPADAAGNLTQDIDGRSLIARFVAGRRMADGPDISLGPADVVAAATQATGGSPQAVAGSRVPRGGVGAYVAGRGPEGPTRDIFFDRSLPASSAGRVIAHEFGHAVEDLAGQIPSDGLTAELGRIYNDLNNPQDYGKPFTPASNGYKAADAPHELMAEAVRAYMADPNYLKTVAPNTAAAIRAAVNGNPRLNRTIQFNTRGDAAAPLTLADVLGQQQVASTGGIPGASPMVPASPQAPQQGTIPPEVFARLLSEGKAL